MYGDVIHITHKHQNGDETQVFAKSELVGQHRQHCLCYECSGLMKPNGEFKKRGACKIAKAYYRMAIKHSTVTPVFECPQFVQLIAAPAK